ncbi:MAG: hypothetical protein IIC50_22920 [Planctomycetes bacterium]|nr:hypothetical protein [Planctomycetota bacterium]
MITLTVAAVILGVQSGGRDTLPQLIEKRGNPDGTIRSGAGEEILSRLIGNLISTDKSDYTNKRDEVYSPGSDSVQ